MGKLKKFLKFVIIISKYKNIFTENLYQTFNLTKLESFFTGCWRYQTGGLMITISGAGTPNSESTKEMQHYNLC